MHCNLNDDSDDGCILDEGEGTRNQCPSWLQVVVEWFAWLWNIIRSFFINFYSRYIVRRCSRCQKVILCHWVVTTYQIGDDVVCKACFDIYRTQNSSESRCSRCQKGIIYQRGGATCRMCDYVMCKACYDIYRTQNSSEDEQGQLTRMSPSIQQSTTNDRELTNRVRAGERDPDLEFVQPPPPSNINSKNPLQGGIAIEMTTISSGSNNRVFQDSIHDLASTGSKCHQDAESQTEPCTVKGNENKDDFCQIDVETQTESTKESASSIGEKKTPDQTEHPKPPMALGITSEEELSNMATTAIQKILAAHSVDVKSCYERSDLVDKLTQLWKDLNKNAGEVPEADRCLICMDSRIDCVFLECGHTATCHECGLKIKDCPVCRMYIVRVVRTYRP